MEKENKKEYEEVASFVEGDCTYIIKQPKNEPTQQELEKIYFALGRIIKPEF